MRRLKIRWIPAFALMASMLLSACGGSSSGGAKTAETAAASETAAQTEAAVSETDGEEFNAVSSEVVDTIVSRGYLNVGCKMDVKGLGYYDEASGTWSGLEVELAYMTAAKIFNVTLQEAKDQELAHITGVSVADREAKLESGEIDCMMATYTITDERAERFALSDSYYKDYVGLMVLYSGENPNSLGTGEIRSIADLDGKNIGVTRGSTTREAILNYLGTMTNTSIHPLFFEYVDYPSMFEALKTGTIDVMSVDVSILNTYVDNETQILNDRFAGQDYGVAVLKENAALLTYINAAIADIS